MHLGVDKSVHRPHIQSFHLTRKFTVSFCWSSANVKGHQLLTTGLWAADAWWLPSETQHIPQAWVGRQPGWSSSRTQSNFLASQRLPGLGYLRIPVPCFLFGRTSAPQGHLEDEVRKGAASEEAVSGLPSSGLLVTNASLLNYCVPNIPATDRPHKYLHATCVAMLN